MSGPLRRVGINANVSFALVNQSSEGLFTVDAATGDVRANAPLDRETRANYWLNVSVRDMGTPSLASSTSLSVAVGDVNDNAPVIECPARSCRHEVIGGGGETLVFEARVREDAASGAQVLRVAARDADAGANAALHYELQELPQSPTSQAQNIYAAGDLHPRFRVDQSGLVTVGARLDAERRSMYSLRVLVSDGYEAARSDRRHTSTATLIVTVDDVNEEAPQWTTMPREVVIHDPEVLPVFSAEDRDVSNTHLTYSVQSSRLGWERVFEIDRRTGQLVVQWHALRKDDRNSKWPLQIEVRDSGSPPRSSHMTVQVTVSEEAVAKVSGAGAIYGTNSGREPNSGRLGYGYGTEYSSGGGESGPGRGHAATGGRSGGSGVADNLILMLCLIAVMVLMIVLCGVAIYILWRGRLNLARAGQQRPTKSALHYFVFVFSSSLHFISVFGCLWQLQLQTENSVLLLWFRTQAARHGLKQSDAGGRRERPEQYGASAVPSLSAQTLGHTDQCVEVAPNRPPRGILIRYKKK